MHFPEQRGMDQLGHSLVMWEFWIMW